MQKHPRLSPVTLRDGRSAAVRPLQPGDAEPLTALFASLSTVTKRLYGPHPFDRVTAQRLCAEAARDAVTTRFVAVLDDGGAAAQIIGYMILTREIHPDDRVRHGDALDLTQCAALAPCVADAFQDQGIGTQMAGHVLNAARMVGLRQVILMGGVQARNARAKHVYEKLGFRQVGEFWTHGAEDLLNYSMVVDLGTGA